jgi:hypothetical protein
MGKTVDMGALQLQNETVRAVGNMNVNARGDILDSQNRVIEPRNKQVQRKYRRQSTQGKNIPVSNSTIEARQAAMAKQLGIAHVLSIDQQGHIQVTEAMQTRITWLDHDKKDHIQRLQ